MVYEHRSHFFVIDELYPHNAETTVDLLRLRESNGSSAY